jgi:hypothetical protein
VSHPEFLFAVNLSDDAAFDSMLRDLARAICDHLGLPRGACDGLVADMAGERARAAAAGRRHADVRFTSHAGELEIVVVYDDGAQWRRACSLS